jgi:hypothetical protein
LASSILRKGGILRVMTSANSPPSSQTSSINVMLAIHLRPRKVVNRLGRSSRIRI